MERRGAMFIQTTLKPGQRGTKRLVETYGDRLVCVRYRCDPGAGRRYKTVELIVEEKPWCPYRPESILLIRLDYREEVLRDRVKSAGGKWDAARRLWRLPYREVVALRLEPRIVAQVR